MGQPLGPKPPGEDPLGPHGPGSVTQVGHVPTPPHQSLRLASGLKSPLGPDVRPLEGGHSDHHPPEATRRPVLHRRAAPRPAAPSRPVPYLRPPGGPAGGGARSSTPTPTQTTSCSAWLPQRILFPWSQPPPTSSARLKSTPAPSCRRCRARCGAAAGLTGRTIRVPPVSGDVLVSSPDGPATESDHHPRTARPRRPDRRAGDPRQLGGRGGGPGLANPRGVAD
jgi:hypothetical protein